MGKGRPRAVEKGVVGASNTVTCCGSTSVPSAPVYYPTEDEFKDPLDYIYKIRPEAEPYGICRIVPPKGWNPPFALDLDTFTFPTKTQAIHKLQARPAASDPKTFDLEYTRFLQDHCGKKSRKRVVFEGEDLDLCKLFNAVKRFGGYDKVVDAKKWGDVARFLRPAGKITDCAKHVLCQLYREHLYDYEEFYNKMNQGNAKNCNKGERDERKSDHRVQSSMSKKHPCKVSGLKVKDCKVHVEEEHDQICEQCKSGLHGEVMLLCDRCDKGWHIYCLSPPLKEIPQGNWYCFSCLNSDRDSFGFVPGKHYTLEAFRRIADRSRRRWFGSGPVSRVQMEKKFWEIVEGSVGEVEVMYGNDLDTSVYGSGFPRVADQKMQSVDDKLWQEYATSPWNLNNLPKLKGSMLRSIQHNITGVMVPWLYIGMLFSSFCWHFEDHCFYSMNYLHWGEPKCWYSVPGSQASAFEKVMRSSLPDLFDVQPDLLFQLVTMLNPSVLQDNGVPVYSVLQEPGNFVITFPRSYHGGFNLGLNCAEAVNFAPADWLPFGAFGADLYQRYHKPAVLSHEELLCVVAQYGDVDSRVSSYLKKELLRISDKEKSWREKLWKDGIIKFSRMTPRKCPQYVGTEEDPTCIICQQYLYLSAVVCSCRPSSFVCLEHWEHLCECKTVKLRLLYRHSLAELFELAFSVDEFTSDDKAECRSVRRQSSCPGALTKKVKGSCVTFDQLATEWLLQASMILQNPFLSNVFVTTLRKAEQFLWAGSEMDSVRDMAKTLVEAQKWAEGIRDCVTKVESWYQDSNVKKVHLEFIDELLRFNPPPCNEPNYPKLKEYAEEARLLVQEIDTALSACSKMSELELLYSRACGLPIYMKVIKKLERRISSTKTWLDSVRKCISERHPTVLEVGILYNLNSEISDLRVHLPEKEVLENLLSQAESCSVQCREMLEGPMNLENVSLLLKEWDNFTVAVPELQLLRQYHSDTVLWLARVNDILGRAPVQGDQHNTVNELMCIFEEGSSLKIQVDELPLVELELKKASCREKALKACDSRMPLEFIQQLLEEATMLHIEEEKLFINLSCVLALAIPWEERAREMLSHENPISDFEDMIRDSENIFAILPSLNDVKDALSEANLWLRNSKPYLVSSARASNSLLKVEDLQMLVSESKLLKISLGERKMLELVLKNCKLWECESSSLLDDCQCLFELDNSVDGISSDLMFRVEDLIARIQSAIASGVSLGFDLIEISKLQASCSTLHWCKRALCFRDCPPSLEDVLEVVEGLSHSSVSGVLLKVLVDGVEWLRRALEGMSRPCNSRRCHLTEVQDTLNDYKNVKMTFGAVYCQLEEAIRKHIIMSSSSSPVNYDNRRFLSEFNQTMYEAYATKKDIIYERSFELDEDEYSEIQTQITLRGWKKLVNPVSKMKSLMVKEFYANAARTQDEMDATEQHPFSSFVRGKKIIFSPANIKRVMKIKDSTPGAETDYDTRQHSNPLLDEVIRDLCVPGATWRYGVTQPPQPIQLRRRELKPLARGWQEFIINNVHPSSNKSEISVPIAILIHCIMKGEDVRIEELISARIALTAQNFNNKNRLGFPSLIYKLCKDAEVPFKEFKRTPYITIGNPITARVMETTRGGALPTLRRHEEAEYESHDQEMHENTPEQNYEEENDDWVENFANHDTYYEQEQHYEQPYYEQQQYQQPPHQQAISFADFQSFQEQLREQQQQHHKSMSDMMNNMHIETLNYFEEMKAQHDNYIENLKSVKTQQETYFEELKTLSEQQEEFRTEQNRQLNIIRQRQDTMAKEISEMKKAQENATAMFVINRKQKEKSNDYPDRCGH